MLSRFVKPFLPKSKCLLISWLQSQLAVTLEPEKMKSLTVSVVSPSIAMKWWDRIPWSLFFECWFLSQLFLFSSFTFIKKLFILAVYNSTLDFLSGFQSDPKSDRRERLGSFRSFLGMRMGLKMHSLLDSQVYVRAFPSPLWTSWRRKWQPTPLFLPRESCGQRSLGGYSP